MSPTRNLGANWKPTVSCTVPILQTILSFTLKTLITEVGALQLLWALFTVNFLPPFLVGLEASFSLQHFRDFIIHQATVQSFLYGNIYLLLACNFGGILLFFGGLRCACSVFRSRRGPSERPTDSAHRRRWEDAVAAKKAELQGRGESIRRCLTRLEPLISFTIFVVSLYITREEAQFSLVASILKGSILKESRWTKWIMYEGFVILMLLVGVVVVERLRVWTRSRAMDKYLTERKATKDAVTQEEKGDVELQADVEFGLEDKRGKEAGG
jgi:hypothetical protein